MTKREKKKLNKARSHARNERCHVCTRWRLLTDEHFPPQSAGNNRRIWAHTINGLTIGAAQNKIAPPMEYGNGLKRRSVCQECNHKTQRFYNAAFREWTDQARAVLPPNADTDSVEVTFKQIEPLAILKQVLMGALAACDFCPSPEAAAMRRMVLNPSETGLLSTIKVLAYLNPPRVGEEEDIGLTTKRVCWHLRQFDVEQNQRMFTFAEYATCPLGYVVLSTAAGFGIFDKALELADITSFATYECGEKVDVEIRLPIRNPFGPASCHFANVGGGGKWYLNDEDAKAGIALAPIMRRDR